MFDTVIFERGNRKVVGEAQTFKGDVHNVLTFYEDDKKVMCAILYKRKFLEFKSSQFKKLSGYSFIEIFLREGIEEMKMEDIDDYFCEPGRALWERLIYLKNGMEYECLRSGYKNILFLFKEKVHRGYFKTSGITYRELSRLTIKTVFDHISSIDINGVFSSDWVGDDFRLIFRDYGMKINAYNEMERYLIDVEYLKKIQYYDTGHFFKLTDETKKELTKRKLLLGELPMLLAVDSNGYAIFDGVPYMCNK